MSASHWKPVPNRKQLPVLASRARPGEVPLNNLPPSRPTCHVSICSLQAAKLPSAIFNCKTAPQ